jgi:hypothetical protein
MATTSVPRRGWRGTRVARREGCVAQTLHAAAGELSVAGRVGSNAGVAGGEIEFRPRSEVLGQLSVVRGDVQAAGGRLRIDGPVGGDVLATSGQMVLGPNARIAGKLHYSGAGLQRYPAAQGREQYRDLELRLGTRQRA